MIEDNQTAPRQKNTQQSSSPRSFQQELKNINDSYVKINSKINESQSKFRLSIIASFIIIAIMSIIIYGHDSYTNGFFASGDYFGIYMVSVFALIFFIFCIGTIIGEQLSIATSKAQLEGLDRTERNARYFAIIGEKPSYYDILVRINIDNLTDNYTLIKTQVDKSFRLTLGVGLIGFFLIGIGLVVAFFNINHFNAFPIIASASGILTEFVSGIFFVFHMRTVRQMKEYHNDLLDVQNVLLSFKIIGDTDDEKEKAKLISQIVTQLTGKRKVTTSNE